jgi:colicin import membrane protein
MAAKETKKPAARPTRSRAETQREFAEISEEAEAGRQAADAKTVEAAKIREAEIRQEVGGIGVETVVQRISELGLDVSRTLAELSEKLTAEVRQLALLREAVALERKELERLHKIDVAATALDQMVDDHAREKQRLEAEIFTQRKTWEDESGRLERERKEQEENLKKQRQREIEDYEYKKALDRKKAQDKHEEELRVRDKKNEEKQEALERSWQSRETSLKESEEQLDRLRKEVDAFPAKLQKETETAALQGRREAEAKLQQQIAMLEKDAASEKRISELQVKTLEEALSRNAAQITALEKQLADAKQQVQDIAVKAIEGASGARALSHINQIAMEQAKNRPQG